MGEIAASPIQSASGQRNQHRDNNSSIAFSRYRDNGLNQEQVPYSIQEEDPQSNCSVEDDVNLVEILQIACENIELTLKEGLTVETQERLLRLLIMTQQVGLY